MVSLLVLAIGAAAIAVTPAKPARNDALQSLHGHGHGHGGSDWSAEPRVAVVRRGDAEHVVLADCKTPSKNYFQSSQMAYYVGPPNDAPDAIADVSYGKQQAWAGSGKVTGVFPDNIGFTADIPVLVGEGQFAGVGQNGHADFSCYARFKKALYTTEDGTVCDGIYDCDRSKPPVSSSPLRSSSTPPAPDTSPVASTAPPATTTTPLSPTATPTTVTTLVRANNNEDDTDTNSGGRTSSPAAGSTSTEPSGPSSSSSTTAPAATATGSGDAAGTGHSEDLTKDQKIAIGVGLGVGLPTLLVGILAWLFPQAMKGQGRRAVHYLHTVVTKEHTEIRY